MQISEGSGKRMTTLPEAGVKENAAALLDEDRLAWLALVLSPGLGPKRIVDAVAQLDAASQIFSLPLTGLEALRFPAQAAPVDRPQSTAWR